MLACNRIVGGLVVLSIVSFPSNPRVYAQDSGAAKVYRTQFVDLHARVKVMLGMVEQQGRTKVNPQDEQIAREEILALQTLAHRLGEEAGASNIDILKRGRDSNKTLLLVSQGCEAISFVLMALDNFIDTKDRAFIGLSQRRRGNC